MKKLLILFIALGFTKGVLSQNVGVGTNTPVQKLDVAGNINTTGNLMVNGVAGADGQVLTMNGSTMQWMDKSRFKNWAIYHTINVATFTVPAGITEVLIEMWGAGGGGHSPGGGGGSGGYWVGLIPVTPGGTINLTVGAGGSAGATDVPAGNGGNTGFSCTGFNVSTEGGTGADTTFPGTTEFYNAGVGGDGMVTGPTLPVGFRNYFLMNGNNGSSTEINFMETSPGIFAKFFKGGVGGVPPFSGQKSSTGTYFLNNPTGTDYRSSIIGVVGVEFGVGGTPIVSGTSAPSGLPGGPGRIIIYY